MRVDKISALVHRADTVCISICCQAEITSASADCARQCAQVLGDGFRMHPAESRIHVAPDFVNFAACALQDAADCSPAGTVHRIHHYPHLRVGDDVEVDQVTNMLIICRDGVEAHDLFLLGGMLILHKVGAAALLFIVVQIHFHPAALFGRSR